MRCWTKLGAKRELNEFGMSEEDVQRAAENAMKDLYANPRMVELEPVTGLIWRCRAGVEARADF